MKHGEIAPVIDAKGRHRGTKTWVVCSMCEQGRWVRADSLKLKCFTGLCNRCHAKFDTGNQENHGRWKGGIFNGNSGYMRTYVQPDDPFYTMAGRDGSIFVHRLVMARYMQRCLLPWEIVHHKNGVKNDNRLENLQLISGAHNHVVDLATRRYIRKLERHIAHLQGIISQNGGGGISVTIGGSKW